MITFTNFKLHYFYFVATLSVYNIAIFAPYKTDESFVIWLKTNTTDTVT